jgi:hypothetical protein
VASGFSRPVLPGALRRPAARRGRCSGPHLAACFRDLDAKVAIVLDVLRAAFHTNSWTCSSRRPRALFSLVSAPRLPALVAAAPAPSSRCRRYQPHARNAQVLDRTCPSLQSRIIPLLDPPPGLLFLAGSVLPFQIGTRNSCRNKIQFRLLMSPFSGQIRIELLSVT